MPNTELRGIEVLNNDETPMEEVVRWLEESFGLRPDQAFGAMLEIHRNGQGIPVVFPARDLDLVMARAVAASRALTGRLEFGPTEILDDPGSVHLSTGEMVAGATANARRSDGKYWNVVAWIGAALVVAAVAWWAV